MIVGIEVGGGKGFSAIIFEIKIIVFFRVPHLPFMWTTWSGIIGRSVGI